MLRCLDVILSFAGLVVLSPLLLVLLALGLWDTGSPLFLQTRVGHRKLPFRLVKFRTMHPETVSVATHMVDATSVTPYGRFLRRTKLDELPQLWNVLIGEMSLVGPRPCLFSQQELIEARDALRVFDARPGITGLAQLSNIDMSTPRRLAKTDAEMLDAFGMRDYMYYIGLTLTGRGSGDPIRRSE